MKNDNICTYFVLSFMLSFDVIIFHGQQMLSFLRYHFPLYIFCVIIYVIIWCYHLLLSFPPFFFFLKTWHTPGKGGIKGTVRLESFYSSPAFHWAKWFLYFCVKTSFQYLFFFRYSFHYQHFFQEFDTSASREFGVLLLKHSIYL